VASSALLREISDGVVTLTLNRPEQRNSINAELRDLLAEAIDEAALSPEIAAIVITGSGGAFCAGGDLAGFDDLKDPRAYRWLSRRLSGLIDDIERVEKPTIAVVDGVATGAGLALALACDWRIGTPDTRLLWREGALGIVATHGGCARLVKLVGLGRAKQVMLGGDDLTPSEAHRVGLINEMVNDGPAAARQRAARMRMRAPLSYGAAKRTLQLAADSDTTSAVLAESLAQQALLATNDHAEGLAAVRQRRAPAFTAS
jgi:enoyl-CoA hydratase/carnithine racemase